MGPSAEEYPPRRGLSRSRVWPGEPHVCASCACPCDFSQTGTRTPTQDTVTPGHSPSAASKLLAARARVLARARFLAYAAQDLLRRAALCLLGDNLGPVRHVVAGAPGRLLAGWRLAAGARRPVIEEGDGRCLEAAEDLEDAGCDDVVGPLGGSVLGRFRFAAADRLAPEDPAPQLRGGVGCLCLASLGQ